MHASKEQNNSPGQSIFKQNNAIMEFKLHK